MNAVITAAEPTARGVEAINPNSAHAAINSQTYLLTYGAPSGRQDPERTATAVLSVTDRATRAVQDKQPDNDWRTALTALTAFEPLTPSGAHFITLGSWRGRVIEVSGSEFAAVVTDQLRDMPEESVRFSISELSEDDLELVAPGAHFYWSAGYEVNAARTRKRVSVIRFRRLPLFSREERERAEAWADSIEDLFEDRQA